MTRQEHPVSIVRNQSVIIEQQQLGDATSLIQYQSDGHALIIGSQEQALIAAAQFTAQVKSQGSNQSVTVVCIDGSLSKMEKRLTDTGVAVFLVPALELSGYLGAFKASVPSESDKEKPFDLAVSVYRESGCFDVVLDLSPLPLLTMQLPPLIMASECPRRSLS